MTISIRVTNTDSRESAIVEVRKLTRRKNSVHPALEMSTANQLKGGESKDFHVWDDQSLVIEEVQNG